MSLSHLLVNFRCLLVSSPFTREFTLFTREFTPFTREFPLFTREFTPFTREFAIYS
ncbi:hypothetical protein H7T43_04450 [Peribacillus simplex]|uniref:hypothetical protein n=1 Tax=Peribacillus simplex TaxID=1478 RepID=UPI002989E7BA|nr:hypothetical protein [Peribacillus simplex]MBX9954164.1 hypothetical protein [Peribacillus simplex]